MSILPGMDIENTIPTLEQAGKAYRDARRAAAAADEEFGRTQREHMAAMQAREKAIDDLQTAETVLRQAANQ